MDDIDLLPPSSAAATSADEAANNPPGVSSGTAVVAAAGVVIPTTIEEQLTQLTQRQDEQAQQLSELRSRILELEGVIHEMKQDICSDDGRGAGAGNGEANPPLPTTTTTSSVQPNDNQTSSKLVTDNLAIDEGTPSSTPPTTTTNIATSDDEISNILTSRQERNLWPLKRKYCTSFSRENDLMKLRFHNSELYSHKTVRIPKQPGTSASSSSASATVAGTTAAVGSQADGGNDALATTSSSSAGNYNNIYYGTLGNKEGRLICRLCSGKTMNRNTSWMCSTCIVPLCIDIVDGDPLSSCFAKWHTCQDLVMENYVLNGELREKRSMKKQRTSGGGVGEGHHVGVQEGNHNHSSEEVDLDALGIVDDATKAI